MIVKEPLSENKRKRNAATPEECVADLTLISQSLVDQPSITRAYYRKFGKFSEAAWIKHFGTFQEFKCQAGLHLRRHARKMGLDIAKHASLNAYEEMNVQKRDWSEKYKKPTGKRFETILVGSDVHDIECDPFWRLTFVDTARRAQPDKIVINGDLYDLPEFGKYSVDPREFDIIGRIKWVHKFLGDLREAAPDAELILIEGNHESVHADTEVLTRDGWVAAIKITHQHQLAQVDLKTSKLTYAAPIAIAHSVNDLVQVSGDLHDELLSITHHVVLDGKRTAVRDLIGKKIKQTRFSYAAQTFSAGIDLSDNEIRLLTWVVTDATIVRRQLSNTRIQWKLSRQDKIENLKNLLEGMGIRYTIRKASWSARNKLQPYYICVYGDAAREIYTHLDGVKTYPQNWTEMSNKQAQVLIDTLLQTDGGADHNHMTVSSVNKKQLELLQRIFIHNGIASKIDTVTNGSDLTEHKRLIHTLSIFQNGVYDRRYVTVKKVEEKGLIVSIQTHNETLVTRRNGRPVVTGNCRLLRHLSEATPSMKVLLSDLHGMTVPKLLGLDKFEVNYVAPADLATFTKSDFHNELKRNHLVMHDFLLFHHFPEGRSFGLPGVNGHHHKHLVDSFYSPIFGSYEWHQLGCGHKREATYTNGEKWNMGFALIHVDTEFKRAQFEYIDVTHKHVVIGGKWYVR